MLTLNINLPIDAIIKWIYKYYVVLASSKECKKLNKSKIILCSKAFSNKCINKAHYTSSSPSVLSLKNPFLFDWI